MIKVVGLNEKDRATIDVQLKLFIKQFENTNIQVTKFNGIFYITKDVLDKENPNWVFVTHSIYEIKGWLYGIMQFDKIIKEVEYV